MPSHSKRVLYGESKEVVQFHPLQSTVLHILTCESVMASYALITDDNRCCILEIFTNCHTTDDTSPVKFIVYSYKPKTMPQNILQ